ncbi:DnaJ domain-containing protein [Hydrogenovibrio marinus]|uniref:Molecular chaperone DnaJ n=1 Tax=Hydrogenovibrio marinus TaxID=28885 RepID=A0A066ZS03_HYDMR|nr:DnaJ domain-containing protein [Hydrogenovibrio marinus]KDN95059.1 molecular chaperone DnaJ [Hydrogenovibrio marinus]
MVNSPFDVTKDYFAILGVHHLACDKTIKQAYRKMARRYHPDVSKIHNATQKFQEVSEAFEILTKHKDAYWKAYCRHSNRSSNTSSGYRKNTRHDTGNNNAGAQGDFWGYSQQARKPIRGKDKVITYPLTLRYAIRLLKIGYFYIPGLKIRMKFSRLAFQGKTFRIRNKGYPGLFGGENGDYLVKFSLKMTGLKWELKGSDLYGVIEVPEPLLASGSKIELESPVGPLKLVVPKNYSSKDYIKVENMGLPGDEIHSPGHLFAKLIAA